MYSTKIYWMSTAHEALFGDISMNKKNSLMEFIFYWEKQTKWISKLYGMLEGDKCYEEKRASVRWRGEGRIVAILMWGQRRLYQEDDNWVKTCRSQGNGLRAIWRQAFQAEGTVNAEASDRSVSGAWQTANHRGDSTVTKGTCTSL